MKIGKKRNFSCDHSKIYPFAPIKLNDSSLLDESFNRKFQKKLKFLTESMQTSINENAKNKQKDTLKGKQKSKNLKVQEMLKYKLKDIFSPQFLQSPNSIIKSKNSPKSPSKASPKVGFALRKTISFAIGNSSKRLNKNKSLHMNESLPFEPQPKSPTELGNFTLKQRGLSDEPKPKCQFDLKKNHSFIINAENSEELRQNLEKKQEISQNEAFYSMETLELLRNEIEKSEEMRNVSKLDSLLGKLYYLKKFSPFCRKKILRCCKFYEFEQNTIIFKQGDVADNVYIVLRGAVSIQVN